jgi:hypothetical protein
MKTLDPYDIQFNEGDMAIILAGYRVYASRGEQTKEQYDFGGSLISSIKLAYQSA